MKTYFMHTDRLGFSTWTPEDLGLATLLWGDGQVTRFLCAAGVFTQDEIAQRLRTEVENGARYGVQYWPVFCLDTAELAGCCGLRPIDAEKGMFEFGIHLRPAFWGRGLATEAAGAVLTHALDLPGICEIVAGHHPQNEASMRMLQRIGFHYLYDSYYEPTGLMHPAYRYDQAARG